MARPIVEGKNAFIVDIVLRGQGGNKVVEVFIDTDDDVSIDLCSEISREFSRALDATDLFRGGYHLVVSSPGLDRPLKFARQYSKHIGRRMIVEQTVDGQLQKIEGKLTQVTPQGFELLCDDDVVKAFTFDHIADARVKLPW